MECTLSKHTRPRIIFHLKVLQNRENSRFPSRGEELIVCRLLCSVAALEGLDVLGK